MKYHHLVLFCSALASILSTRGAYSDGKVTIYTKLHSDPDIIHFSTKNTVTLYCNTTETGDITWEKGSKPVTEVSDLKDRVSFKEANNSTLILSNLKESDVGNYTCVLTVGTSKYTDTIALATANSAKWGVRVPKNVNVVEGEKLTIKCDVRGDLTLQWYYTNTTSGGNATLITDSDERIKLSNYHDDDRNVTVVNGELRIDEVDMGDRGDYTCDAISDAAISDKYSMICTVRIKDKYAALWPFLGICAEVFVLCAIIFIYEKKRNKSELEESDTDQSPDQKNTPDHGKESNLRHRQ